MAADSPDDEYRYGDGDSKLNSTPNLADKPVMGSTGGGDSHHAFRSASDWMRSVLEEEDSEEENSEEENRVVCGR